MSQSLTSRYVDAIQRSFAPAEAWTWPRKRTLGEPSPDSRLLGKNICGPVASVTLQNGAKVETRLRAISQHDIVLSGANVPTIPILGQVVEVAVRWDECDVVIHTKAIVHWSGNIAGQPVVALFTIKRLDAAVENWLNEDNRGEIRFPAELNATIEVGDGKDVFGRMVDYSLSGCQLITEEAVELDVEYPMTVLLPNASVQMSLRPRWVLNTDAGLQMGCTFAPEQGVLLACRHHPLPTGLSCPMRPQTTEWNGLDQDGEE